MTIASRQGAILRRVSYSIEDNVHGGCLSGELRAVFVAHVFVTAWLVSACSHEPQILSGYGTMIPVSGKGVRLRPHNGVDVGADVGSAVIASADGIVVNIHESDDTFGDAVTLIHPLPITRENRGVSKWTVYWHLRRSFVRMGQRVSRGDRIGEVGLFPASGGIPHVHWKLCRDRFCALGTDEDPLKVSAGCFRLGASYPKNRLVLTYPVACR